MSGIAGNAKYLTTFEVKIRTAIAQAVVCGDRRKRGRQ
jgi:hypothetical protein